MGGTLAHLPRNPLQRGFVTAPQTFFVSTWGDSTMFCSARNSARAQARAIRLGLEQLEDRALLTTYYLDSIGGNDANSGTSPPAAVAILESAGKYGAGRG